MKKVFNFLLLSVLCSITIMLSSCNSSSSSGTTHYPLIVKTHGNKLSATFTDAAGNTYVPESRILSGDTVPAKDGHLACIGYVINDSTTSTSTKTYTITLKYFVDLETS